MTEEEIREALEDMASKADWEGGWGDLIEHGYPLEEVPAGPFREKWERVVVMYRAYEAELDEFIEMIDELGVDRP